MSSSPVQLLSTIVLQSCFLPHSVSALHAINPQFKFFYGQKPTTGRFMSTEANPVNSQLPFPLTEGSNTTEMAQSSNNDGFRQAMLKAALKTAPQLSEENYSIWVDKMTALLELRGVLTTLEAKEPDAPPLAAEINAALKLLFISKMDSLTHSNIVTTDNRSSARSLWKAIKDRFVSNESSNRAQVFNEFLYVRFKVDALEAFVTNIKVAIKKLVDIMHLDKTLNVQFVCNHLTQFNNENRAESKESTSTNQAALVSTKSQRSNRNGQLGSGQNGGSKRCTTGSHSPKQDQNHSSDACWHLHPDQAPEWWREAQAKWQASKNVNYYTSLITLWTENTNPKMRIVLDSGASAHIFNDTKFFSQLELGNHDVIQTGKKDATLPIEGTGRVTLQWSTSTVLLDNCLYVPDIVINLISAGALLEKGCQIVAKKGSFTVSKEQQDLFKGSIDSNLFLVDNPDAVGGFVKNEANLSIPSAETLKAIHEKYGHASIQRIDSLIPSTISKEERDSFECKACILSKITKQSFNSDSTPASKVFERIHLDTIGPITPESKIRSRFILVLVDNFSGYLAGFPLVKKDNTTDILIKVLETEKKRLGYFPSLICSNGGGEFMGSRLVFYLDDNHIQRLISKPYHPEHNGGAKRANRTIVESTANPIPQEPQTSPNVNSPEEEVSIDRESSGQKGIELDQDADHNDSLNSNEDITQILKPKETKQPPELNTRALRDRATIKPPVRFGFHHYYEPNTFESAICCPNKKFWKTAISAKIGSIKSHDVWDDHYEEPPNPLDTTWVFKIKDNCHGNPLKHKARLCMQGFEQIEGVDHGGTFAPTGKVLTLRMTLIYSLHQNLTVTQFHVQGAFLHAPLSEGVFIKTPKGVNCEAP
ncbi:hypothetical protein MJO28_016844 [Puccinia striiformis f. sp. tritici]|nr:hypothetical protein MJO28_016844 [Puccinia striiformis f. sp. tritici]